MIADNLVTVFGIVGWIIYVGLLLAGVRAVLGLPPVAMWFRSRPCPWCEGKGHIWKDRRIACGTNHEEVCGDPDYCIKNGCQL